MSVKLYSAATIEKAQWTGNPYADYARRYLVPLVADPGHYIKNIHTPLHVAMVDQLPIPFSEVEWHPNNSYTASPFSQYISYGIEELRELGQPLLERIFARLLRQIGRYFQRCNFDHALLVNNWFLSTNLYPEILGEQIEQLHHTFLREYPKRALVWRSVDTQGGAEPLNHLRRLGYMPIFSRQVWYQDPTSSQTTKRNTFKTDARLLRKTPYRVIPAAEIDPDRAVNLYNQLYLDKYSTLNPQFTPAFIRLAQANRILEMIGFERDGRLDAVMGYFGRGRLMTPPLFGYDLALDRKLGLYRLLSARFSQEAARLGKTAHFSAGVGEFKRNRGAYGVLEYNMVYVGHLPPSRRRPWQLLKLILDRLAVPIITSRGL
ncbi:MAG: GNAT family N-acetyltransferase [Chloroflexota bacterium]